MRIFCTLFQSCLIFVLPVILVTAQVQLAEKCYVPIDLVFALDASGSVKKSGFEQIKSFTKNLVDGFKFGIRDTHVGIVTFSEVGEVQIGLTDTFDKSELFRKIDELKYDGFRTNTNDALEVVSSDMFSMSGGTRQGVSKVLILLTDGKCTLCGNKGVEASAKKLKDRGVTIFTIGVTDSIDRNELEQISSDPSEKHMFFSRNFEDLKTSIKDLQGRSCTVKKGKCMMPPKKFNCGNFIRRNRCQTDDQCPNIQKCCFDGCEMSCKYPLLHCQTAIDIAFAIDSSSSVRAEGFTRMKQFAGRIAESFSVSQTEARFATLIYSREAEVKFKFERYDTAQQVTDAIDDLPHSRADTRIDKALQLAKSDLFSLDGKVRTRRPMVLIVFFDGDVSRDMADLEKLASPLKNYGVKIVAIGVGSEVNIYQIKKVATDPGMIYDASTFNSLMPELFNIAKETCNKKFGECSADPNPLKGQVCNGIDNECEDDFDCFGNSKCCHRGCKKKCVKPPIACLRKMDIAFAIDSNTEWNDFLFVKSYIKNVIDQFEVSEGKTHVSLLRFGKDATVEFDFNSDQSSNQIVKSRIDGLRYERGLGTLSSVLGLACDAIFCQRGGTREKYHKMMILITGPTRESDHDVLQNRIQTLRKRGVDVLVVGVGDIDTDMLQRISNEDAKRDDRVLLTKDYQSISQYIRDIPDFACGDEATNPEVDTIEGCKPKGCLKGEKGTRGRPGDVGPQGYNGGRGPAGPKGLEGPKGGVGNDGSTGVKGIRGDPGLLGLPGFTGYNGIPGVPGEIGPPGFDGGCGLPGDSGEAGATGEDGFIGPMGERGQLGFKGQKGFPARFDPNMEVFPGDKGDRGDPALKGRKGQKGVEGNPVFNGDLGPDGTKGLNGDIGEMGDYGKFIYRKGTRGDQGEPGFQGNSGVIIEVTEEQIKGVLKGEPGLKGDGGAKGNTGLRGDASTDHGRKGQQGIQGPQGYKGYKGVSGLQGLTGILGERGFPGDKGFRGIEGQPGKTGIDGLKGDIGSTGYKGTKGALGDEVTPLLGYFGKKGDTGEEGFPGREGASGIQGPKGFKGKEGDMLIGPTGDPGGIGLRGRHGDDGLPGIVGMEGFRGVKGPNGDVGRNGDQGLHGKGIPGRNGRDGPPGPKGDIGPIGNTGPPGVRGDPVVVDCEKSICPKGRKGQIGAPGNTGIPGESGSEGLKGLKGYNGGPCPLCPPGQDGRSGEPGNPGTIGENGEPGNVGDIGIIGLKGVKGSHGLDGAVGPKGKDGQQGDEGLIGEPGDDSPGNSVTLKGFKGASGAPGTIGIRGPNGLKGKKGVKGPTGSQGSRGQRGVKGIKGRIGVRGFNGEPGRPGKAGDVGDLGHGYPGVPGNLGQQGKQGPDGAIGLVGLKGQQGTRPTTDQIIKLRSKMADFVGRKGISGSSGEAGMKGEVGSEGFAGADGERGPKGLKGFGGPKGNIGSKGRAGEDGDPGSSGLPGRNGPRGPPGDPGKVGERGKAPRGDVGEPGLPGIDGNPGKDASPTMGCVDFGDPTDIAFIMDSSRSVTGEDFDRQKEFIKNFLKRFPISAQQTQAGIIKYGRTADIEIPFNKYTTESELGNAISEIQHAEARESRLDLAFRVARDQLFTAASGSRGQRVNKALVLLGDGFISGGREKAVTLQRNAKKYAEDLKQEGVTIFALGVGAERNKYLLKEIVSDDSYYLEIESYSDLLTRIYEVQNDLQDTCTYIGEPGRDGLPGEPGEYGKRGEKGKDGLRPAGFSGLKGPKGFKGDAKFGVRGEPGLDGIIGRLGQKGSPGKTGRNKIGDRGAKGYKGERSDIIQGPKGKIGDSGLIGPVGPKSQSLCDNVLATDIVFVLDTSSSVGHKNFHKMKRFVQDIVRSFDVDNQLTRVSIITYDETALLQIPLSRHNSLNTLLENIDRLRYGNGQATRTDKALLLALTDGYAEKNGARSGVNKALVFMTDGQQSYAPDQNDISDIVKNMESAKIYRYAIGIGREIASNELYTIASDNVVYAENFDQLKLKINDQIGIIARRGCQGEKGLHGKDGLPGRDGFDGQDGLFGLKGNKGQPGFEGLKGSKGPLGDSFGKGSKGEKGEYGDPGPQGLPGCEPGNLVGSSDVVTDVVFMLDASGSLYSDGFRREKEFVKNVIDKMGEITFFGTHVGIIVYSDEANIRIRLNDHYNNYELKNAIDNIPYDSQGTRIDLGFKEAKKLFDDDTDHGARGNSKKVLILLTDGQQTYVPRVTEPSVVAKELIADGIDIFAIGIGPEIDRVELESFISKPEFLFLAPEIDKIVSAVSEEITTALKCEGGPRGPEGQPGDDGPPGAVGRPGPLGRTGFKGETGEPGFGIKGDKGEEGVYGLVGVNGEVGFRGPEGPVGEAGLRGLKGYPGPPGIKGDPALPGFVGNDGPPGPNGDKGEQGVSVGTGYFGEKGFIGEVGRRGPPGDVGVLPLGNVIKDYRGPKGAMGLKGYSGGRGVPGQLLVAPGPAGTQGSPGDAGDRGEFGLRGQQGKPGPDGSRGIQGGIGLIGIQGSPGRFGKKGFGGKKGESGFRGRTRKGERGPPGIIGKKGDIGPYGRKGFPGFIGMPGKRGNQGEAGFPGLTPKPVGLRPPKGVSGKKGEIGDIGASGEKGDRAPLIDSDDIKGKKGSRGAIGKRGEKGFTGEGIPGHNGFEGLSGFTGSKGDPGEQGPRGKSGPVGQVLGIEHGDIGDLGPNGSKGRIGTSGIKGLRGRIGRDGSKGFKGEKGGPGFQGLRGDEGPPGLPGPKGVLGDRGKVGESGEPGVSGHSGIAEGFYIVVHSQDPSVPSCPEPSYRKMWEGYSLMYTVGNGKSHSQDLGDPGSCVKSFSTMPFLFCDRYDSCKYASRNDFVYWLSGDVTQPMMPVSNTAIEPFISRCVVCEAPSIHIAVHSQDSARPTCPQGWDPLWRGYSFMMVAGAGKTGAGQSLSSSGSCLKEFRPKPFIECQGARGTCHFFSDKYSFWLTTINPNDMFTTQQPKTLIKDKGDDLKSRVSRCRVCIRANSRPRGGDPPDGNNKRLWNK